MFGVFKEALRDLGDRRGVATITGDDALADDALWRERRSLFRHLAATARAFWVAEQGEEIIGYGRSARREDLILLTEFFVAPRAHGMGIGRDLLERTFPGPGDYDRALLSTLEVPAMASYLKAGLNGYFPVKYFSTDAPQARGRPDGLEIEELAHSEHSLDRLERVDREILGHSRRVDHEWFLNDRQGFLYLRRGRTLGYGYVGAHSGPFAALDGEAWPAVLTHAETVAARRGHGLGLEIPLVNRPAIQHVLDRSYRMSAFTAVLMADRRFGRFEDYIVTDPAVML